MRAEAGPIESHFRLVIVPERQKKKADDLALSGQSRSKSSCDLHPGFGFALPISGPRGRDETSPHFLSLPYICLPI